jgi:hypothetical protein
MSQTTIEDLEKRVLALEQGLGELLQLRAPSSPWKDWRQAVGRFVPGELSEEVDAAGRALREAERAQPEP